MAENAQAEQTDEQKRRAAYSAATSRLREEQRDRFNELQQEEMAKRGIEWSPRPDAKAKAAQQIEALLAEHPELRERYAVEG